MRTVDLTPLKDNDTQYEKIVVELADRFKCEWDDSIHDSYDLYVRQLQEHSQEVRAIRCKAETLEKEAEELKVDELKKKADVLCREADSV